MSQTSETAQAADREGPASKATASHIENETQEAMIEEVPGAAATGLWTETKKTVFLLLVAFHAMMGIFMIAGIIPAFSSLADRYKVSEIEISYLVSVTVLFVGVFPIFWSQISNIIGLNLVLLISVLGACVCNIAGGFCTSYGSQMTTRVLMSIFICPPLGLGSKVATELFEPDQRGEKLGMWTLMSTLGAPGGPFIMGFVIKHLSHDWVFWIFAIINICQLIAYLVVFAWGGRLSNQLFSWRKTNEAVRAHQRPSPPIQLSAMAFCLRQKIVIVPICAYAIHDTGNPLGQGQEEGRDQGHSALDYALLGVIAQQAWNQGEDLYAYNDSRILLGAEYFARYNLGYDVPFENYTNGIVAYTEISSADRGSVRWAWEVLYNHYVMIKGQSAPWTTQYWNLTLET